MGSDVNAAEHAINQLGIELGQARAALAFANGLLRDRDAAIAELRTDIEKLEQAVQQAAKRKPAKGRK
jgi:hypothetical protein